MCYSCLLLLEQHRKQNGNVSMHNKNEEMSPSPSLEKKMSEKWPNEIEGTSISIIPTLQTNNPHGRAETRSDSNLETSKKRKSLSASDVVAGHMVEFLKRRTQPTPSANPNLKFFESLIPDMEKLSSKRIRTFKFKIMGLLNELLEDQENEDSAKSSAPSPYASTPSPCASTSSHHAPAQYGYATTSIAQQSFQNEIERDCYVDISTGNNSWNELPSKYNWAWSMQSSDFFEIRVF